MFLCFFAKSFAQITFTDSNFKNALLTHSPVIDTNGNNQIEISEAAAATKLNIINKNISNLEGIKYFTNLDYLDCSDNNIQKINTETLTELRFLIAERNKLVTIDVRNCQLWSLRLDGNPIEYAYLTGRNGFQLEATYGIDFGYDQILNMKYVCVSQQQIGPISLPLNHRERVWDRLGSALHIGECTIQTPVACQPINFPDPNFKQALLTKHNVDTDGDGEICIEEAEKVTLLHLLKNSNITDITGIEYFTNLEGITLDYNNLPTIDLSKNVKLKKLHIKFSKLTHIDLKKNINLEYLRIDGNPIKNIDLSLNKKLIFFSAYHNQLTNLDISNLTNLKLITVAYGKITELKTDNCTSLFQVDAWDNLITKLNFTTNINLNRIRISNNYFSEIDIRNCKIKGVSMENNPNLKKAYLTGNHGFYENFSKFSHISGVGINNCPNLSFVCVNNVSFLNDIKTFITNKYPSCTVSTNCNTTTPIINFNTYFTLSPNPTTGAMWLKRNLPIYASSGNIYNAQTGIFVKKILLFKDGLVLPFKTTDKKTNSTNFTIPIDSVFIDVSNLKNGTYILKVHSNLGNFTTKFIKSVAGAF